MSIFKRKKCIGWDIGSNGIRAVELIEKDGRAHLQNFAYLDFEDMIDLTFKDERSGQVVVEAMQKILNKAKFSTIDSFAVIPGFFSFNKIFKFSKNYKDEDIDKWLDLNISNNIYNGRNILLDWQTLSEKGGTQKVFASAVSKTLVDKYKAIFKKAGFRLLGIETTYHSLIRSIFGTDNTNAILIDIGSRFSDLTIIKDNIPYVSKSLKYGGHDVSIDIGNNLNIDINQANQIKKDSSVIDKKLINKIKQEINILLENYHLENDKSKPDKIILTGGELRNSENCKLFKKYFNIDTYLANPWSRISYNLNLKEHLDKVSPNFAVAAGSAMKIL